MTLPLGRALPLAEGARALRLARRGVDCSVRFCGQIARRLDAGETIREGVSSMADQWRNKHTGGVVTYLRKDHVTGHGPVVVYRSEDGTEGRWALYGCGDTPPWIVCWEPVKEAPDV